MDLSLSVEDVRALRKALMLALVHVPEARTDEAYDLLSRITRKVDEARQASD